MLNGFTETSPHAYASPSNELHDNESRARYIIEINNSCGNVRQGLKENLSDLFSVDGVEHPIVSEDPHHLV